jgi:flagellar assembly protein FliH
MNSPSDGNAIRDGAQPGHAARPAGTDAMSAFVVPERSVVPFEFRSLSYEETEGYASRLEPSNTGAAGGNANGMGTAGREGGRARAEKISASDPEAREAAMRMAIEAAREEGQQAGEREGRRAARAELEAESKAAISVERDRLIHAVHEFRVARDRYFAGVEPEVVKLALAISGRVLHREAQIDPLLLAGVVRVALEKMADRSGVVMRVCGEDVGAWERVFQAAEASEQPRVVADAKLGRGECVLETKMGTVELGVRVQLEEIEKGFFDLLNHRPVA